MGIVNVTPDSFYDGGKRFDSAKAVADALEMVRFRCRNPGCRRRVHQARRPNPYTLEEELRRVSPVIRELRKNSNVPNLREDLWRSAHLSSYAAHGSPEERALVLPRVARVSARPGGLAADIQDFGTGIFTISSASATAFALSNLLPPS